MGFPRLILDLVIVLMMEWSTMCETILPVDCSSDQLVDHSVSFIVGPDKGQSGRPRSGLVPETVRKHFLVCAALICQVSSVDSADCVARIRLLSGDWMVRLAWMVTDWGNGELLSIGVAKFKMSYLDDYIYVDLFGHCSLHQIL